MSRKVVIDDLLDARGGAELLGLPHYNTVSVYQDRYEHMPRPVSDLGKRRVKLWPRAATSWIAEQADRGGRRPNRSAR